MRCAFLHATTIRNHSILIRSHTMAAARPKSLQRPVTKL
jgi:hypothetical protein